MIFYILKIKYLLKKIILQIRNINKSIVYSYNVKINKTVKLSVYKNGNIFFGEGCRIKEFTSISSVGGKINLGKYVFFNRNCNIVSRSFITIGDMCAFGPNVCIYDHNHKFNKEGIIEEEYKKGSIIIGNKCWIGANVTILANTKIGDGCIIGAGTVISGNIPAHSIVTQTRQLNIIPIK